MNHEILDRFRHDPARVLDQLVDGELSEPDRRGLLAALDDEPGGWRCCALAFLEAQVWRQELRGARQDLATVARSAPRPRRWTSWWAIAASALVALGGGYALRGYTGGAPSARDQFTLQPAPAERETQLVGGPQQLRLRMQLPGREDAPIEVPVTAATDVDPQWLVRQRSALPEDVYRALERAGHRVERGGRLWPIKLEDGRQLVVPVEEVDVHYVGRPVY